MAVDRLKIKMCGGILALFVLLIIISVPLLSFSSELIHTIQIGSYPDEYSAERQYNSVLDMLTEDERGYLRIEKIGIFYALRLGKFSSYGETEDLYDAVKSKNSKAMIMSAYIKDERLVKLYASTSAEEPVSDAVEAIEEPSVTPEEEKAEPQHVEEADYESESSAVIQGQDVSDVIANMARSQDESKETAGMDDELQNSESSYLIITFVAALFLIIMGVFFRALKSGYTIQIGSFTSEDQAYEHYESVLNVLEGEEREYLRIEKMGLNYLVRVGKFKSRGETNNLMQALKPEFPKVMALNAALKGSSVIIIYKESTESKAIVQKRKEGTVKVYSAKPGGGLDVVEKNNRQNNVEGAEEKNHDLQTDVSAGILTDDTVFDEEEENTGELEDPEMSADEQKAPERVMSEEFPASAQEENPILQVTVGPDNKIEVSLEEKEEDWGSEVVNAEASLDENEVEATETTEEIWDTAGAETSFPRVTVWPDSKEEATTTSEEDEERHQSTDESDDKKDESHPAFVQASQKEDETIRNMAETYYNLGTAYSKSGNYKDAIEAYKAAIEINPHVAKIYYNLGIAYSKEGMHQQNIEAYKEAISINPEYVNAYYNLGTSYSRSGMYEEAIENYQQAIRINPDFANAHYNLGIAYIKLGLANNAITAYKEAIKINPNFTAAHNNLRIACSNAGIEYDVIADNQQAAQ